MKSLLVVVFVLMSSVMARADIARCSAPYDERSVIVLSFDLRPQALVRQAIYADTGVSIGGLYTITAVDFQKNTSLSVAASDREIGRIALTAKYNLLRDSYVGKIEWTVPQRGSIQKLVVCSI